MTHNMTPSITKKGGEGTTKHNKFVMLCLSCYAMSTSSPSSPPAVPDRGTAGGLLGDCRGTAGGLPGDCQGLLGDCWGTVGIFICENPWVRTASRWVTRSLGLYAGIWIRATRSSDRCCIASLTLLYYSWSVIGSSVKSRSAAAPSQFGSAC